jgi:hypothetical protein
MRDLSVLGMQSFGRIIRMYPQLTTLHLCNIGVLYYKLAHDTNPVLLMDHMGIPSSVTQIHDPSVLALRWIKSHPEGIRV